MRSMDWRALALATTLVLGLGIGSSTLVFSLLNGLLLRPLPYPEPERLIEVWNSWPDETHAPLAFPELRAYGEGKLWFSRGSRTDR